MIIIFILSLLISIFSVNCVISWQNEVNGHDKASRNGYAGVKYYRKSDFYLCSERNIEFIMKAFLLMNGLKNLQHVNQQEMVNLWMQ